MKNCVMINLGKNEVTVKLDEKATHEEIIEVLKKKISELKKLYKDETIPLFVTGKVLKDKEMVEIKELIQSKIEVEVEFDSPKSLGLHGIKRTFDKEIESSETKFYRGSLRSGQKIEYEGSIVVLGDVNGGAELVAGDNIVVLGILRGLAHAGAKGNKKAIIAASSINTPQIRIANVIKEIEKGQEDLYRKTYAYIEDNDIVLE